MIPLAYNTNGFQSHTLEDAARIIADLGYSGIALTPDVHHLDPYTSGAGEIEAFRSLLEKLGLGIVIETGARYILDPRRKHFPSLLSDGSFDRRQDFLERCVDLAVALGAGIVSTWSGALPAADDAPATADPMARLAERLAPVCDHAAARGVVLAFEPEPGMLVEGMAHFETLEAEMESTMGGARPTLTLDVGHAHITERDPPETVIAAFADRIVNVHLDDVREGRHVHLPPGEGEIDFGRVLKALEALETMPFVSLELSRHSHDAVNVASRAIRYLRQASGS